MKIRITNILAIQSKIAIRLEVENKASFYLALVDNVSNNSSSIDSIQTKRFLIIDSI